MAASDTRAEAPFQRRLRRLGRAMAADKRLAALVLSSATGVPVVRPLVLRLRLLLACDARCRMCLVHSPLRTADLYDAEELRALMPAALAARLMDEGRALGATVLNLQGGEPFLHPAFGDILGHGLGLGFAVQFFTNGGEAADIAAVERALAQARGRARIVVRVSIDGVGAAHDAIRGVPGAYRRALRFIRAGQRLAGRDRRLQLGVSCTVLCDNAGEVLALADHFASLGLAARFFPVVGYGPRRQDGAIVAAPFLPPDVLPDRRQQRAVARALPALERHPGVEYAGVLRAGPALWGGQPVRNICLSNSIGIYVTATGRLQFCPISAETVGSVAATPLAAAWTDLMAAPRRESFASCLVPCTCYRPEALL